MADKPFPTTEADLNLLLQNINTKIGAYTAILGLTAGEIQALNEDAQNFEYIIEKAQQVNDSKDAFFSFKSELIDGEPSGTELTVPTFSAVVMPDHAFPGIKKRLRALIQRIKTAPGYTEQIGEDLGLVDGGAPPEDLNSLTAELKVKALSNGRVEIAFSKQGQDAMKVEFQRKGDTNWSLAGIYTSSPGIHDTGPNPSNEPESRQYRGILTKKNEDVGNVSPIYTVVTTP